MSDVVDALLRDLLAWLAVTERPYADVMDSWRTSCPRLPVWEEAIEQGFLIRARTGDEAVIRITPAGRAFLAGGG